MDSRLMHTLKYAEQELHEIRELIDQGKLTEKGAFVRMFCLGKVLVGWDNEDKTRDEQVQYLLETDEIVQGILDQVSKIRAS